MWVAPTNKLVAWTERVKKEVSLLWKSSDLCHHLWTWLCSFVTLQGILYSGLPGIQLGLLLDLPAFSAQMATVDFSAFDPVSLPDKSPCIIMHIFFY